MLHPHSPKPYSPNSASIQGLLPRNSRHNYRLAKRTDENLQPLSPKPSESKRPAEAYGPGTGLYAASGRFIPRSTVEPEVHYPKPNKSQALNTLSPKTYGRSEKVGASLSSCP